MPSVSSISRILRNKVTSQMSHHMHTGGQSHNHTHLYNSIYPTYQYTNGHNNHIKCENSPNTSCSSPSPPNSTSLRNAHCHWPSSHSVNDILAQHHAVVSLRAAQCQSNQLNPLQMQQATPNLMEQQNHQNSYNYYMPLFQGTTMHHNGLASATGI